MNALSPAVAQLCLPQPKSPMGGQNWTVWLQTNLTYCSGRPGRAAVSWVAGLGSSDTLLPSRHKNMPWRRDGSRRCARLRACCRKESQPSHLSGKFHQTRIQGVSGNVPNSLEDLDKLATMLVFFLFFLLPDDWVTWMMDKVSRLVLGAG